MQLHELMGGNVRRDYTPGDALSLFNYRGPRGGRLLGLLDDADAANLAGLEHADVVVGTPQVVARLHERDGAYFDDLKGLFVYNFVRVCVCFPSFIYSLF
jgi:hypothetical protein